MAKMKILKIKSVSDVITNSSTEVFRIKCVDDFKNLSNGLKYIKFTVFNSVDDIRDFVVNDTEYPRNLCWLLDTWDEDGNFWEKMDLFAEGYALLGDSNLWDENGTYFGEIDEDDKWERIFSIPPKEMWDKLWKRYEWALKHWIGYAIASADDPNCYDSEERERIKKLANESNENTWALL